MPDMILESPAGKCLLLACSPRAGGNTDTAAQEFVRGFTAVQNASPCGQGCTCGSSQTGENNIPVVYVRNYRILPCVACGCCFQWAQKAVQKDSLCAGRLSFGCPLTLRDDSAVLLRALARADRVCIVSPIYFYHLPAQFKALLDRLQPFWTLRRAGGARFAPRSCQVILLAARARGEKLFAGSLLTLKYALLPLGITLEEPLLLYSLDEPGDLEGNLKTLQQVFAYGKKAFLDR